MSGKNLKNIDYILKKIFKLLLMYKIENLELGTKSLETKSIIIWL